MKEKLDIAFIGTPDYPIPAIHGGAIQTLVTALIDKNEENAKFNITIYTINDSGLNDIKYKNTDIIGIKLTNLGNLKLIIRKILRRLSKNKISYRSEYMNKINKELLQKKYDYVIFETTDKEVVQLDVRVKKFSRIFFHIHADYINDNTDRINEISKLVDTFICVSDFINQRLKTVSALSNSNILTLPNAIEEKNISLTERKKWREDIRKKYGFSKKDTVFIYCSRLSPEKGCLELEEALLKLNSTSKLLIVGGTNFSSNKKTKYLQLLKEKSIESNGRIFFTGAVAHEEVVKYMVAADIAVVPSICNEACSLTMLEFRASGLPTIVTNIGGIPEFTNIKASLFVNYDENFVWNLTLAMKELLNDLELRKSLEYNSNKKMDQFYYQEFFNNFVEIIEKDKGGVKD